MNNDKIEKTYSRVLAIAGSDSGGGAGIQADIKAISATGAFATTAITAVTVQNTVGVAAVFPIPVDIIKGQIEAVLSDIGTDAVKIGMLHSSEVVRVVRKCLESASVRNIVLDPVMVATSGDALMRQDAIKILREELIPLARVVTPNIPEAEELTGEKITGHADLLPVARKLSEECGGVSVLLKAGHSDDDMLSDVFYNAETGSVSELTSERYDTFNTHGTGCTMSSAFASYLAQGLSLDDAARASKLYVSEAIAAGASYVIGHGHGPVKHFYGFWQDARRIK